MLQGNKQLENDIEKISVVSKDKKRKIRRRNKNLNHSKDNIKIWHRKKRIFKSKIANHYPRIRKKDRQKIGFTDEYHSFDDVYGGVGQPDLDPEIIGADFLGAYHDYCDAARIILSNNCLFYPVVKDLKVKELESLTQYLSSSLFGDFFSGLESELPEDFAYTVSEKELFYTFVNDLVDHYFEENKKTFPELINCEKRLKVAVDLHEALDDLVLDVFENNTIVGAFVDFIKDRVNYIIEDGLAILDYSTTNPELNSELIAKGYIPSS